MRAFALFSLFAASASILSFTAPPPLGVSAQATAVAPGDASVSPAVSLADDTGEPAGPGRWEENDPLLTLTGTWQTTTHSKDSGGSTAFAKITGDSAQITFRGVAIKWVARTGPALGIASVTLDGEARQPVDLFTSAQFQQQDVYDSGTLPDGVHTLVLTRTGTRNPASRGNDIVLDSFLVTGAQGPAAPMDVSTTASASITSTTWKESATANIDSYRVWRAVAGGPAQVVADIGPSPQTYSDPEAPLDADVSYSVAAVDSSGLQSAISSGGTIRLNSSNSAPSGLYEESSKFVERVGTWADLVHSSDSARGSSNAKVIGDYAQVLFTGTGVQWIGRKGPSLGKADVFVDGTKVAVVDLYNESQVHQQVLYSASGLSDGAHRLRIVRSGAQNPASKGKDISLDAVRVVDETPPAVPSGVTVTAQREGLLVKWAPSTASDIAGYVVYRAKGTESFDKITVGALLTDTTFLDIGLDYGESYRYAITAVDSSGNVSARSTAVSRTQPNAVDPATRAGDCPSGGETVSTLTQLRSAIAAAGPGTVIRLAPGSYKGGLTVTASGTKEAPIWICGPKTAILDNENLQSKNGVLLQDVSYVNVAGFSIRNFRKGVVVTGSTATSVADLDIREIGEEAVKVRYGSSSTVVQYNTIRNTGRAIASYGEGIYLGTSPQNWCDLLDCQPDATTLSQVIGNSIAGTTADPIEAKPGTTSGVIRGNTLDGSSLTDVTNVLAVKGNDYLVTDNIGRNAKGSGVIVMEGEVAGNGSGNFIARNSIEVPSGEYAIFLGNGSGNVVDCTNLAPTSGSLRSNAPSCQK